MILYEKLYYEFNQQFVEIGPNLDFQCKSCKCPIELKRFMIDGAFDEKTKTFQTFSVNTSVNIEYVPEYEKYKICIRSVDKLIDRISSIMNIQNLMGDSFSTKTKRRVVIKAVIDLILAHNQILKDSNYMKSQERIKLLQKIGTTKDLSNIWVFELDNSIFIYSSKERDFFKIIKYDNVIAYIIILLILELNDSMIINLKNEIGTKTSSTLYKICSYSTFKKIGHSLFKDLNIIINKSFEMKPINDFPILCYLIYIFSCFITRYNLWLSTEKVLDKKKFDPNIQKHIIHTVIELLNTILKVDVAETKKKRQYLYEIIDSKFYSKLDFYKDQELLGRLDELYLGENSIKEMKVANIESNKFDINPETYDYKIGVDLIWQKLCKKYDLIRYRPEDVKHLQPIISSNNLTNCKSGTFHDFKIYELDTNKKVNGIGGKYTLKCTICGQEAGLENFDSQETSLIKKAVVMQYLRKMSKKYCKDGKVHLFIYETEKFKENTINIRKCKYCGYKENSPSELSDSELLKLYKTIDDNRIKISKYIEGITSEIKEKDKNKINYVNKIIEKVIYKFEKVDNDITINIDLLLDNIQKLLGKEILINNNFYNLYDNIFIIDHDNQGKKLDVEERIYEKDNKFREIKDHSFFKRDVLVYTIMKNTKYEVFYDLYSKNLLGYREVNKDYNIINKYDCKIRINYSIKNILTMFGFTRNYIELTDFNPEFFGFSKIILEKFKQNIKVDEYINKIFFRRFLLIKKLCLDINTYINRFYYKYKVKLVNDPTKISINIDNKTKIKIQEEYEISNSPLDLIYNKFTKKIENLNIEKIDPKGIEHIFLKYFSEIYSYYSYKNYVPDSEIRINFINFNFLLKKDYNSNVILNYLIDEINRLLSYNDNKVIKQNLMNFILELIVKLFNMYNYDVSRFDIDVNNFIQTLYSSDLYLETQLSGLNMDIIDYYGNQETLNQLQSKDVDDETKEKIINDIEQDIEEVENFQDEVDWENEDGDGAVGD